jgi:hypothetical protein
MFPIQCKHGDHHAIIPLHLSVSKKDCCAIPFSHLGIESQLDDMLPSLISSEWYHLLIQKLPGGDV